MLRITKLCVAVLSAILLSACATTGNDLPIKGDRDHQEVQIRWVRVDPTKIGPLCASVMKQRFDPERMPQACATYSFAANGTPTCTIYAPVPRGEFGMETFGHETLHCFVGNFHG